MIIALEWVATNSVAVVEILRKLFLKRASHDFNCFSFRQPFLELN
jgi:hypothetical protein